jgi:phosphoribosyl-AMP cyclohydrolase / phosphoribosyl-ATP pyrophosphohydrolase
MIIPSIDLQSGKAVQLKQGRERVLEHEDPVGLARDFTRFGEIAVIDLDAALDKGSNHETIRHICRAGPCRVGGGIRSVEKARQIMDLGVEKLIFGTRAFCSSGVDHEFLKQAVKEFGRERIMVALDVKNGKVVTKGWRESTGLDPLKAAKELEAYVSEFLMTCVDREGMMEGTDLELFERLKEETEIEVTAAGGVTTLDEIRRLSRKGFNIQLGMALYTGAVSLPQAFSAALDWGKGLLPTVTRDLAGRILMLAYSSRESLQKTFETGLVWYYSRSRKNLWQKGETSGHIQKFMNIRQDCDGDALLITAEQTGPACHTGRYSCFGPKSFNVRDLGDVIRDRLRNPVPGSYTASLDFSRIQDKIREEAEELIDAQERDHIIWEAADLFYFVNVWLAWHGVSFEDVIRELGRRRSCGGGGKK